MFNPCTHSFRKEIASISGQTAARTRSAFDVAAFELGVPELHAGPS